ncbi:hypothetical protein P691DRAFT_805278 [Macrolepiota fuliginosa MF-IS2]|uniref:Uncharacterized protein n=1 Tax=Macrolepiota fuliginosa MF-IS2 TaxID=1400762 RepID=A0A9P5X7W2_9AGAR|nr:hypothetical protein P691DRAFT_805278 [Macrolepiota fuliginosa MF-IS2]
MLSLLCCLPKKRSRTHPDERTYLIPTEPQQPNVDDETTRRQRALQDRLTRIVRAKEGKMVNLHARLPFNLHNRSLSARLDPSSSRSASDSLLVSPTSPRYPISYAVPHTNFYTSPLGLGDSRRSSASRSSSVAFAVDVAHHGDDDIEEGEDDHEGNEGDDVDDDRTPILNLRLVIPAGPVLPLSRGRSPLKSTNEEDAEDTGTAPQTIPPPLPKPDLLEAGVTSPSSTVMPVITTPRDAPEVEHLGQPTVSISPASTISFRIQETTPLILDWET